MHDGATRAQVRVLPKEGGSMDDVTKIQGVRPVLVKSWRATPHTHGLCAWYASAAALADHHPVPRVGDLQSAEMVAAPCQCCVATHALPPHSNASRCCEVDHSRETEAGRVMHAEGLMGCDT